MNAMFFAILMSSIFSQVFAGDLGGIRYIGIDIPKTLFKKWEPGDGGMLQGAMGDVWIMKIPESWGVPITGLTCSAPGLCDNQGSIYDENHYRLLEINDVLLEHEEFRNVIVEYSPNVKEKFYKYQTLKMNREAELKSKIKSKDNREAKDLKKRNKELEDEIKSLRQKPERIPDYDDVYKPKKNKFNFEEDEGRPQPKRSQAQFPIFGSDDESELPSREQNFKSDLKNVKKLPGAKYIAPNFDDLYKVENSKYESNLDGGVDGETELREILTKVGVSREWTSKDINAYISCFEKLGICSAQDLAEHLSDYKRFNVELKENCGRTFFNSTMNAMKEAITNI